MYCEANAMVEDYQQALSVASLGSTRDVQSLYPQLGLKSSPQVSALFRNSSFAVLFPFTICCLHFRFYLF